MDLITPNQQQPPPIKTKAQKLIAQKNSQLNRLIPTQFARETTQ